MSRKTIPCPDDNKTVCRRVVSRGPAAAGAAVVEAAAVSAVGSLTMVRVT